MEGFLSNKLDGPQEEVQIPVWEEGLRYELTTQKAICLH